MNCGKIAEKIQIHYKCRNSVYPKSVHKRFGVPDDKVSWNVAWPEYKPICFSSDLIQNKLWADPCLDDLSFRPLWNALDGAVNRKSHLLPYKVVNGFPLNPVGRTGVTGRGILGRWGPNHAADPIITRWKRNSKKSVENHESTGKSILQFIGIERRDCKEWAFPGGMVDPGESISNTLKREFLEEAMNILSATEEEKIKRKEMIQEFFQDGVEIYKGYVDDPRNTDNAWMETVATNFHDENGKYTEELNLMAGDDAAQVRWIDVGSSLNLYASHLEMLAKVASLRNCHW